MRTGPVRARRATPRGDAAADYEDAFDIVSSDAESLSAEQWARTVFEEALVPMRLFLLQAGAWCWACGSDHGCSPTMSSAGWSKHERRTRSDCASTQP